MKNLQQIKVIHAALNKEKDKILSEVDKINVLIKNKKESIKKILSYQGEYSDEKKFILSKSIPILNKNLNTFKGKLNTIILNEENEIEKLVKIRAEKFSEIEKIDRKLELMDGFKERREGELAYEMQQADQAESDELSSAKHIRKNHE